MSDRRGVLARACIAVAALLAVAAAPASAADYRAYASCANAKPYPSATHCTYDSPGHSRTTFVFRSNVGKREYEVCQRITGLPFRGHQCVKSPKAAAYTAIPCNVDDPGSRPFTVTITIKVRKPGSSGAYRRVARTAVHVSG
jgi:hypothetical protein